MAKRENPVEIAAPAPRENPELLGHEAAEETLRAAWNSGRLAHAWLLVGPRGIGKATLAFRFARFVLKDGAATDADGLGVPTDDPVFRRVASGGHADLVTLERGINEKTGKACSDIIVEDVRKMSRFMGLTAGEGTWRVVIVDGAEDMNRNAANALLKHLEEPPPATLFLIVSHAPARLLPTVRSRCRRLVLRELPDALVESLLSRYLPDLGADERATLMGLAEGSPGRAISLAERGGAGLYRDLLGVLRELPALDVRAAHALGDRAGGRAGPDAFRTVAELITWWLARLVRQGATGVAPAEAIPGEAALNNRLLGRGELDQWVEVWEKLRRLFAQAEAVNLEPKQVLLNAFTTLQHAAKA